MTDGLRAAETSETGFHIDMAAADYLTVLRRLHAVLRPRTYLEIGTRTGDSLRLSSCASVAIDPFFAISADIIGTKPVCHLYQTTSDRFFRDTDVEAVLGGKVELAFLDGMHLAEYLLRDVMNLEKRCRPNSVLLLHDCMPSDVYMACRMEGDHVARNKSLAPNWWTGDVWKAVWALLAHRPDLKVVAIDSPPTGLVGITNLDPGSTVLDRCYAAIVREMTALGEEPAHLQRFLETVEIVKPSQIETIENVARHFYL